MRKFFFYFLIVIVLASCKSKKNRLFRLLTSSETSVTFSNNLTPTEDINPFNFTNFYNGGGVGIADFNRDGLPDLCFTANQADPEIYLGKGQLKYQKLKNTGLKNPGWATGVSIFDANQDGWPDIYISMAAHPELLHTSNLLYINQRTEKPSFKEESARYGLDFKGFTMQTVFFDYDNDGDLDAYLLNTDPDVTNPTFLREAVNDGSFPSTDKLFENTGLQPDSTYRYVDVSEKAGIRYEGLGLGVALADFNSDGFTDIYCSNDFQSDDILYMNNGDGTFSNTIPESVKHTALFGMGIDAADFNNDGNTDIFQLDMLPEDSERQKQMIARNDYEKKRLSVSAPYNYQLQYMRNMLQVNVGKNGKTPLFSEQGLMQNVATTDWSWSILLADYDLDGQKDAFIANGYRKNVTDLDFVSYNKNQVIFGDESSRKKQQLELLKEVPEIKLKNYAFRNRGEKGFTDMSEEWGLNDLSYSNGAAYADLDLDGDLDLVVNNIEEEAFIYENLTESKHSITLEFKGKSGNLEGIGASVSVHTGDSIQYFQYFPARGYLSSMNGSILVGLGNHGIADSLAVRWPNGYKQVVKEIKAGEKVILSLANALPDYEDKTTTPSTLFAELSSFPYKHQESQYVDFHHTPTLQKMLSRNGPSLVSCDLNGDDLEDVILGGAYQGSATVAFLQTKTGQFKAFDTLDNGTLEAGAIATLDANLDGKTDVLLLPGYSEGIPYNSPAYQPKLFINTGTGLKLSESSLPTLFTCSEAVLVHDFNGDGQSDVLIGGGYIPGRFPEFEQNRLLINQNGKFILRQEKWLGNTCGVKSMIAADLDGDKTTEILYTGHWGGVYVLKKSPKGFEKTNLTLPHGWWNCLIPADIDGDGDTDLVLGNEGLNSLFKASEKQPVSLLAKDFNKDDRIDPVWGLYLKNKEVTVHPLGTLAEQVVQYKKRFISFTEYSKASLDDLFTSGDLKGAKRFEATELRTGLAINDGKGNFSFKALPFASQTAPVSSILFNDFTGDGQEDLLLVGNFYDNESSIGQSDASFGTLLTGDGKGNFEVVPNRKTGLFIPGNARKAILLPKTKHLLVSQNNDQVAAFGLKAITQNAFPQ